MRAIANVSTRMAERYLPDAFVLLAFLTLLVLAMGLLKGYQPQEVLDFWSDGFFNLLEFTAQSTLVLVTGFALAHTPLVKSGLVAFAKIPKNEVQVIALTTLVMMAASWFSWGFGLIAGAIVAREMGIVHRGKVHYPLVVAASYAGFLVWHAGYGGAIPTLIATDGHFLSETIGVIPVTETIFSSSTLIILFGLAVVVPVTMVFMRPKNGDEIRSIPQSEISASSDNDIKISTKDMTPAEKLESSRFIPLCFGVLAFASLVVYFYAGGVINLNIVILSFFALGLILTPSASEYIKYFTGGARSSYGIIMQFPFYGAIMGVMIQTGIAADIAQMFTYIATDKTLPFWGFISAGIVNIFVPSGGGSGLCKGPLWLMQQLT